MLVKMISVKMDFLMKVMTNWEDGSRESILTNSKDIYT